MCPFGFVICPAKTSDSRGFRGRRIERSVGGVIICLRGLSHSANRILPIKLPINRFLRSFPQCPFRETRDPGCELTPKQSGAGLLLGSLQPRIDLIHQKYGFTV